MKRRHRKVSYEVHYSMGHSGPAVFDNIDEAWARWLYEREVPSYISGKPMGDAVSLYMVTTTTEKLG